MAAQQSFVHNTDVCMYCKLFADRSNLGTALTSSIIECLTSPQSIRINFHNKYGSLNDISSTDIPCANLAAQQSFEYDADTCMYVSCSLIRSHLGATLTSSGIQCSPLVKCHAGVDVQGVPSTFPSFVVLPIPLLCLPSFPMMPHFPAEYQDRSPQQMSTMDL